MNLGLSIFRSVRSIDPALVHNIRQMERTHAFREIGMTGVIELPRETLINIDVPLTVEANDAIVDATKDFVVVGPNGEIVARAATIPEAETILSGATVRLVTKIDKAPATASA